VPATQLTLPTLSEQAERLIAPGVHEVAGLSACRPVGLSASELRASAAEPHDADSLLVIHPDRTSASALVPLLEHRGKRGFVVVDMPDVDDFAPIEPLPSSPVYRVAEPDRGDHMANWSPDEALPAITAA